MPPPGHAWWHLILSTRSSWLPGDPRGFRSRDHRVHCSGDYKNPPPKGEHERLHHWAKQHANETIVIPAAAQPTIGQALYRKARRSGRDLLCVSVSKTHAHLLICLPDEYDGANRFTGQLKQYASHQARSRLPGRIWGRGGKPIRIRDQSHQHNTFQYIIDHAQKENAWVWTFRDARPDR